MIRFWAWVYRTTGWFSPWARVAEYKALREWAESRLGEYDVGVKIGSWQSHNKFYRKVKL